MGGLFFQKYVLKQNPQGKLKKIFSVGATAEEIFKFNLRTGEKVLSSSFLRSTFAFAQTRKLSSGRMKYKF